jgi:hypothetical protein
MATILDTYAGMYPDAPPIGRMRAGDAARLLESVGETAIAASIREQIASGDRDLTELSELNQFEDIFGGGPPPPWLNTEHVFGFIGAGVTGKTVPIQYAGSVAADETLRGKRLKVTLDRLRAADYPGGGIHRVLVDFYGEHQLAGGGESLHFTQTFRVQDGQGPGIVGYPIFIGLAVGQEGVQFKVYTVNVRNDNDQKVLDFMESAPFTAGLKLLNTAEPAIAPLTGIATGLVQMLAKRNENVPVQDFYMGLDFSDVRTRARLARGSYVAVQIPNEELGVWDWDHWVYDSTSGMLHAARDSGRPIPYNYMVFGVSEYRE